MKKQPNKNVADEGREGRVGMVALAGRPNVGKSTLLNRILGEKIAIVSDRPQTTRNRILGIKTSGKEQLVLVDTPGLHRSRANLNKFMIQQAEEGLQGVDCVVLLSEVVEAELAKAETGQAISLHPDDRYALEQVKRLQLSAPVILALNKIDRLKRRQLLLPLMAAWQQHGFDLILPISALRGEGVAELEAEVMAKLPRGPLLFAEDMITDCPERFLAAELIREQVFLGCRQEVPYSTAVEVDLFQERQGRQDVVIEARIHVERESQRGILIGKGGAMIKQIGTAARDAIGQLLGCPVHLKLTVHVETDWTHLPAERRKLGYE